MDQRPLLWDEMLEEFRALDGAADNICLRDGRFGRGLFPRDASQSILVHIPEALLVDVEHIRIDGSGVFRLAQAAPVDARQRAFLEEYQRDFSWGVGRGSARALVQMLQGAPVELRALLKTSFKMDAWLDGPPAQVVPERFFSARYIGYRGRGVLMPIVELANHGRATRYDRRNGIGLSGTFGGEILVRYCDADPLEIFENWGFVSDGESFALSLPLETEAASGRLVIRREAAKPGSDRELFPAVSVEDGRTSLSLMLLGHRGNARLPRETFYRTLQEVGWRRSEAEDMFDRIQQINCQALDKLTALAEGASPPLREELRRMTGLQLDLMSQCAGRCEV